MRKNLLRKLAAPSSLCIALSVAMLAVADDTELYSATYQAGTTGKPKVLVIFDNSGSMGTVIKGVKPVYDSTKTYVLKVPANRIYWSTNGSLPDLTTNEKNQWFPSSANSCANSYSSLSQFGLATVTAQRWQPGSGSWDRTCQKTKNGNCTQWGPWTWDGTDSVWTTLSQSVNNPTTVDCKQDVSTVNNGNASGFSSGYPKKPATLVYPGNPDTNPYQAALANNVASAWSSNYTFYTSHYVNWSQDSTIIPPDTTFVKIAKDVITSIVEANSADIDFGLAKFNANASSGGSDGGLIVKKIIKNMAASDVTNLTTAVKNVTPDGNTPLCETLWESYLYMTGAAPKWGSVTGSDASARSGGKYVSPLEACANTYIIYMTDGEPTYDTAADTLVKNLVGGNTNARSYGSGGSAFTSRLAQLTEYMAVHDLDGNNGNGEQNVKVATIGLDVPGGAAALLLDAATLTYKDDDENTSPAYFNSKSADQLTSAFQNITLGILTKEATFTSPAVAVDSFSRTQSHDAVFYAMFEPKTTTNWSGNIKKLKLAVVSGAAVIVDRDNKPAFDGVGGIVDGAKTFWGSGIADGPTVTDGGVGALLKARTLSTRTILTNTGTSGALEAFSTANVDAAAYGLANSAALYSYWGVTDAADLAKTITWGWGYDADDVDSDGDTTDTRGWIMADVLHSKPLAINYGALGSFTQVNPDMRIVVGTNDGLLHMFANDDGQEDWAFFPKELARVLTQRRKNNSDTKNVYGIDAPTTTYTLDVNHDGTLRAADGDKVYLYFGLRRGGNRLYAMDISNPDQPAFMWEINQTQSGFSELGQTWSVPRVAYIPGYKDNNDVAKPVLIFGAGYDTAKDSHTAFANTGTADATGRGIFIVDAVTGAKVWSVTPAANSATNMRATALVHSVPADVTPVDSNGDGISDRIYFADTGGNVWRVDMPGNTMPTNTQDKWFITKLLQSNYSTARTDRRFFSAPDVVKTEYAGHSIDAVLIGTGDRTNPISKDNASDVNDPTVDEQFYMVRDERTVPYTEAVDTSKCSDDDYHDFRCNLPISAQTDLYNVTNDPLNTGTPQNKIDAAAALALAHGWRIDLTADGEKSLSGSVTISGKALFTTFSPIGDLVQCGFSKGTGRLYAVDLFSGSAALDFNADGTKEKSWVIGSLILETPTIVVTRDPICNQACQDNNAEGAPGGGDGKIWALLPGFVADPKGELSGPYANFWYREDY